MNLRVVRRPIDGIEVELADDGTKTDPQPVLVPEGVQAPAGPTYRVVNRMHALMARNRIWLPGLKPPRMFRTLADSSNATSSATTTR